MTRLRGAPADLSGMLGWTDVHGVIAALDLPPAWRENGYYVTREATTTPEGRLRRKLWEHNVAWGTDVELDDYLAAVVAAADACAETGEGGGAPHLVDQETRRRVAGEARDELRRLLAGAGLAPLPREP